MYESKFLKKLKSSQNKKNIFLNFRTIIIVMVYKVEQEIYLF
jgi:hypothetical protein